MANTFSTYSVEDSVDNFIYRVLNQFSRWGISEDYIFNLFEKCADDIERLDIIESCLNTLGEFQIHVGCRCKLRGHCGSSEDLQETNRTRMRPFFIDGNLPHLPAWEEIVKLS